MSTDHSRALRASGKCQPWFSCLQPRPTRRTPSWNRSHLLRLSSTRTRQRHSPRRTGTPPSNHRTNEQPGNASLNDEPTRYGGNAPSFLPITDSRIPRAPRCLPVPTSTSPTLGSYAAWWHTLGSAVGWVVARRVFVALLGGRVGALGRTRATGSAVASSMLEDARCFPRGNNAVGDSGDRDWTLSCWRSTVSRGPGCLESSRAPPRRQPSTHIPHDRRFHERVMLTRPSNTRGRTTDAPRHARRVWRPAAATAATTTVWPRRLE
jgi:hypothetical protein